MEVVEVNSSEYENIFQKPFHVFNSAGFNTLNKDKAEGVAYLVFKEEDKAKLGLVGGIRNQCFYSPFSAPFAGWTYNDEPGMETIEKAYDCFDRWLSGKGIKTSRLVFPPLFYNESIISEFCNVSTRNGYGVTITDLNFQFELARFDEKYLQEVARYNARKNYNLGAKNGLRIEKVTQEDAIKVAYGIIETNRKQRGFPLKMSLENVMATSKIIPADFFIVSDTNNATIASAIVFRVTEKIAQVIYWGHNVDYSGLKPINYLSYKLFEFYKNEGFTYLDIGPSTDLGVPNYGLIEFKQSIGCSISPKFTFEKNMQ